MSNRTTLDFLYLYRSDKEKFVTRFKNIKNQSINVPELCRFIQQGNSIKNTSIYQICLKGFGQQSQLYRQYRSKFSQQNCYKYFLAIEQNFKKLINRPFEFVLEVNNNKLKMSYTQLYTSTNKVNPKNWTHMTNFQWLNQLIQTKLKDTLIKAFTEYDKKRLLNSENKRLCQKQLTDISKTFSRTFQVESYRVSSILRCIMEILQRDMIYYIAKDILDQNQSYFKQFPQALSKKQSTADSKIKKSPINQAALRIKTQSPKKNHQARNNGKTIQKVSVYQQVYFQQKQKPPSEYLKKIKQNFNSLRQTTDHQVSQSNQSFNISNLRSSKQPFMTQKHIQQNLDQSVFYVNNEQQKYKLPNISAPQKNIYSHIDKFSDLDGNDIKLPAINKNEELLAKRRMQKQKQSRNNQQQTQNTIIISEQAKKQTTRVPSIISSEPQKRKYIKILSIQTKIPLNNSLQQKSIKVHSPHMQKPSTAQQERGKGTGNEEKKNTFRFLKSQQKFTANLFDKKLQIPKKVQEGQKKIKIFGQVTFDRK